MAVLKGQAAIAKANSITNGPAYVGLCLMFTRTCFNVGAKYSTAALAWANAKKRHGPRESIPAGVPVFFSIPGVPAGHVAISVGGGKIRTNLSYKKTIGTVTIDSFLRLQQGIKLLGWSEDLNGVTVYDSDRHEAKPSEKKKSTYVVLQKTVSRWAVYPTNKAPVKKNAKGYLNPKKFGGLTYQVLKFEANNTVAWINSPAFGKVKLYVGKETGATFIKK